MRVNTFVMKNLLTFLILFAAMTYFSYGQQTVATDREPVLQLTGIAKEDGYKSERAIVTVYENNSPVDSMLYPPKGKFTFDLPYHKDNIYTIEVKRKGFISKRISFYTRVPYFFREDTEFDFEVNLLPRPENPVYHIDYEFPMALVKFKTENLEFDYVKSYTRGMLYDEDKLLEVVYNW